MAQLFRVSKLHESSESQTFTFILPAAAALEHPPEILSRDFMYAGHKWRISLLKQDRRLSPYLQMTSVSEGTRCFIDFAFVLVHRQSFTESEQYFEKQREFNWLRSSHGCRTFVTLDDLAKRQFSDSRGEFLFELVLKNPRTTFEQIFALNVAAKNAVSDSRHNEARDYQRYDTTAVNFGEQEWTCVFCPNMDRADDGCMRHMVQVNRRNRTDTLCKLRYRIIVGRYPSDVKCLRSDSREEIFDFGGHGEAFHFTDDYFNYTYDGNRLQLTLELYSVTFVNHMKLNVFNSDKRPVAQCFDRDRQTWCVTTIPYSADSRRSETADEPFSFTLLYPDVQNIPRNYLRYVSWSFHVVPCGKRRDSAVRSHSALTAIGAPFEHYYSQIEADNGFSMKTKLTPNEVKENGARWLDEVDKRLTVQLEWLGSYLLFHPAYHAYDDVYRKHVLQMRREVQALQAENNSLEKQVHEFQLMLANKSSGSSEETTTRPRAPSTSSAATVQAAATNHKTVPHSATAHRNSTCSSEGGLGVSSGELRRPPRSVSGVDVTVATTSDSARPSTPTQKPGPDLDHYQARQCHGSASEYDHENRYEPSNYSFRNEDNRAKSPRNLAATYFFSPAKASVRTYFDDQTSGAPAKDGPSIRRVASSRTASRRGPYNHPNGDEEVAEFLTTEPNQYVDEYSENPLVRSKSSSPYPQRPKENETHETKPRRQARSQIQPEQTRFGDDRDQSNHQRNRSFRVHHRAERNLSSPRHPHHYGKEAEDIESLDSYSDNYYYR